MVTAVRLGKVIARDVDVDVSGSGATVVGYTFAILETPPPESGVVPQLRVYVSCGPHEAVEARNAAHRRLRRMYPGKALHPGAALLVDEPHEGIKISYASGPQPKGVIHNDKPEHVIEPHCPPQHVQCKSVSFEPLLIQGATDYGDPIAVKGWDFSVDESAGDHKKISAEDVFAALDAGAKEYAEDQVAEKLMAIAADVKTTGVLEAFRQLKETFEQMGSHTAGAFNALRAAGARARPCAKPGCGRHAVGSGFYCRMHLVGGNVPPDGDATREQVESALDRRPPLRRSIRRRR